MQLFFRIQIFLTRLRSIFYSKITTDSLLCKHQTQPMSYSFTKRRIEI